MRDLFEPAPPSEDSARRPLRERLLWFFGLAIAGLVAVAGLSYLLRALLFIG